MILFGYTDNQGILSGGRESRYEFWGSSNQGSLVFQLICRFHWRRKWQPTPVFLPRENLDRGAWWVGCHLWGRTQSDTTEVTQQQQQQHVISIETGHLAQDGVLLSSWSLFCFLLHFYYRSLAYQGYTEEHNPIEVRQAIK